MKETKLRKRIMSLLLCVALLISYIPATAAAQTMLSAEQVAATVTDPGTAETWETMMGTDADGNRYAGRVWVDKSVYKDGDTVVLNTRGEAGSSFKAELDEGEDFQVVFSALGSTMTTEKTIRSSGPLDVVLVLDDSTSMDDMISGRTTRLEKLIEASNRLLAKLTQTPDIRIGIVAYNQNSIEILPFGAYQNGIELKVLNNKYVFDEHNPGDKGGTIQAFDKDGTLLYNNTNGYARGTNTQAGIYMGMSMLENARDTAGRKPVAIVLTDGAANTAAQNTFYQLEGQTPVSVFSGSVPTGVAVNTLLTAAYKRAKVEAAYGVAPMIYGVGVDIAGDAAANAIINPGAVEDGFNSANSSGLITSAYRKYQDWLAGQTVKTTENYYGSYEFVADHGYTGVTRQQIGENIHYVDTYYPVSSAELSGTFDQIYEELSSGVFNPISSSTATTGGTGVDDTPLIYVDYIGQHMQVKEIQSVTLFGASYGVRNNGDGTYTLNTATGINPTTGESWNTAQDITIRVTDQADGTQVLEIRINQEILPIILEQVESETVGNTTTATITEVRQDPLRVYYTVGLDTDILLPGGKVDVSKLQGYPYIDDSTGTVSFYSNRFGVENPDGINGDAHVGFQPSPENRYYYHQTNQGIFTKILDKSGKQVNIPANAEYGIVWNADAYDLQWMTYEEYKAAQDTDTVYTYVTYHHPTADTTDANNAAESVTYLVYAEWAYLKESAAFYDAAKEDYLNEGVAIPLDQVEAAIAAYKAANPGCQLYAVLGIGSVRTSRLHNMTVAKLQNPTASAHNRYAPEYTHALADKHHGNDVVVWLGNNGKLTVNIDTGIALSKAVTANIGNADDTYRLTVTVPNGVAAAPVVVDEAGNAVAATYASNVLTVPVKAGQTVYISGIPGGTQCRIGEIIDGDYYIETSRSTATVTVPTVSQVLGGAAQYAPATVTNAPNQYGDLHITKEITGDHAVPDSVLATQFDITVHVGQTLAGKTFAVKDSDHPDGYEKTVDALGNMEFAIRARQTVDILRLPAGTAVTVTEHDPGAHFTVSYRTRNHSGEAPDSDNALVIPTDGSATAVVINRYAPASVEVDLDVQIGKHFADASVAHLLTGGSFEFLVEKYAAGAWQVLTRDSVSYGAGEYGEKNVTIENVLAGEVYTEVGTYAYRVTEVVGEVANISYDRTVYTFDVVVTDRGGQLEAEVIGINNAAVTDVQGDAALDYITRFTNTYDTAPVSMDITKVLNNHSGDSTVSAAGFKFRSVAVDQNGQPLDPNEPETQYNTIFADAAGQARISGIYTRAQIGTHYYLVYEVNDGRPGWTYSQAQYFVTVVVEEDTAGKLVSTMTIEPFNDAARNEQAPTVTDRNRGQLYFTNTYDPENVTVELDGAVKKELTGKQLEADMFTFHVYNDGDRSAALLVGTNDLNGDVNFVDFNGALSFREAGTYAYDIVEQIPEGAVYEAASGKYQLGGMRYDPTIYDLVVEVVNDAATGKLVASYYFEDAVTNTVTFRNAYAVAPTEYALGGSKLLHGRAPRAEEFSFSLYQGDSLLQTVSNKADGSFLFAPIPYTKAGSYTYTIREEQGSVPGVTYTGVSQPVTVTVTVTDVNGTLTAAASLENTQIRFENTYSAKAAQVTFAGTKLLEGGQLADGAFSFLLYQTDSSFDIEKSGQPAVATNENGAFSFSRSFEKPGTVFFALVEDASNPAEGIVYDRSVHRFVVRVTDIGDGQLKASVINATTGEVTESAAAVSTAVSFKNATFEEVTQKEVYRAGNVLTQIDGQKVAEGDILTYFISYTNYTGFEAVVDIMDVIPSHTSYVEGSASHGGTYAGTHLNWIVNVPKDGTVTVSFDVRVDETDAIVANTAVLRDGINIYSTNEVVNHTIEDVVKKDVFAPSEPTVSIDGNKVYEGDALLYKVSYTNTSAQPVDITITDRIPTHTTYVEGSASHSGSFADGAIRWEIPSVPAWGTVTVEFTVTVNTGIGAQNIKNRASVEEGLNAYTTNEVTNYTVEDEVEKKVFREEAPTVNIDGKAVDNGQTLLYTIRYKNTASVKASVTVTDTVPEYTTYVRGSASHGGKHDSGVITWELEVEAGAEVTVSFQVKVKKGVTATVRNTATVVEGKNTYRTNEVTNPTEEPPAPTNPKTGDPMQLSLWFALLLISTGGILGTVLMGKKKEENTQ